MGEEMLVPEPAHYLLRFDDLCPTLARQNWGRFRALVQEYGIRPILAVVPDNRDENLNHGPADPGFWEEMGAMEADGAAIGLHGYRHVCASRGRSLVPGHPETEFAGVSYETQKEWIRAGLGILRGRGLSPRIWVAPRHGMDEATVRALREEGIGVVSDGFARVPFRRLGVTWIPQQIWAPVEMRKGVWTICLHSNTATDAVVDQLRRFLARNGSHFTSVGRLLGELRPGELSTRERLFEIAWSARFEAAQVAKRLKPW